MYQLVIRPMARKDIERLSLQMQERVLEAVLALREEPRPPGTKKLLGLEGYRIRIGDYRVLFRIDDEVRLVTIYRVKHRRAAYR